MIEVIGGIEPARSLILAALENGASVVTANKALLAEDGPTLFEAAEKAGRDLYYEAAVMAHSPTSFSPPPTAGSSSRPRLATPTRCPGSSCARRASAALPSRSCSTACPRTPTARSRPTCGRCSRTSSSATTTCSSSPRSRSSDELLPADALWPVRAWLDGLAADAQARAALVRRTLRGALASLPVRAAAVERAAVEQLSAAAELRAEADAAYAEALREVEGALRSGSLLRGEVLARWHEVVGTGDVMRALETRVGWLRDRLKSVVTGAPAADAELKVTVENRVEAVVRTARRARRRADGARLARACPRPSAPRAGAGARARLGGLDAAAEEEVRAWQGVVFDLVSEEGASKRATARLASLGVNGPG